MTINNDETTHENDMHVNPDQLTAVQKLLKFLQSVDVNDPYTKAHGI